MSSGEIKAPNGKTIIDIKMMVIKPGMRPHGGSIKEVTKIMGKTEEDTVRHIYQCRSMYGFDYRMVNDRYWISEPKRSK